MHPSGFCEPAGRDCRNNGVSGLTGPGVSGRKGHTMTETRVAVMPSKDAVEDAATAVIEVPDAREVDELEVARELVRQAREAGVALTGPSGLLKAMTKTVIETALDEEMSEHLGYDRHAAEGRGSGNSRNGTRSKTVLTDACGAIEIEVPRDRAGTFEPQIVKKRQRRLTDVDEVVLSLYARGLTTGEISAHFADIYGAAVSKDTISRITDKVIEEMAAWHTARWSGSMPQCSSTLCTSRSATARSGHGPSTPRSGWIWAGIVTCWVYGPARAMGSRPSTGWRC